MGVRMERFKRWVASLSFRSGLVVAGFCVLFYILSFAQMLLPVSATVKGTLWVILFGLAKTAQYTALLILGKAGVARIKSYFRKSSAAGD